jgi:anoctamin-4
MFVLQHIVFALTGLMQYVIPDVPSEVRRSDPEEQLLDGLFQLKTQIQREALLAKEAKYEHGLKKSDNDMYEDLMHTLKENNNPRLETTRPGKRVVLEN